MLCKSPLSAIMRVQQIIARLGDQGHKTAFWSALASAAAGVLIIALGTRLGGAVTATGLLIFATSSRRRIELGWNGFW